MFIQYGKRFVQKCLILLVLLTSCVFAPVAANADIGEFGDKIVVTTRITGAIEYLDWFEVTALTTRHNTADGYELFFEFYICAPDDPEFDGICADKMVDSFWGPWFGLWPTIEGDTDCLTAAGYDPNNDNNDNDDNGDNGDNGDQNACDDHSGEWDGRVGEDISFTGTLTGGPVYLDAFQAGTIPMEINYNGSGQQVPVAASYFCRAGADCFSTLTPMLRTFNECIELGDSFSLPMNDDLLAPGVEVEGTGRVVFDAPSMMGSTIALGYSAVSRSN